MPGTAAAHNHPEDDLLTVAPAPPPFWGQVRSIHTFEVGMTPMYDGDGKPVLKENGKQRYNRPEPYDPNVHGFKLKQVEFILAPLDSTQKFRTLRMGYGSSRDREFHQIVQTSIEALRGDIAKVRSIEPDHVIMRHLEGLFVYGTMVPREEGSTWSTLRYEAVFTTEAECVAHQAATRGQDKQAVDDQLPFPGNAPAADPQRAEYAKFLPTLWDQAMGSVEEFNKLIAASPLFAELFPPESDEVRKIIHDSIPF